MKNIPSASILNCLRFKMLLMPSNHYAIDANGNSAFGSTFVMQATGFDGKAFAAFGSCLCLRFGIAFAAAKYCVF